MLSLIKTGLKLLVLLISLSSCQSPSYKIVERCVAIEELDICRCSKYDFNVPEQVEEPYDMSVSYCDDLEVRFSKESWNNEIVPVRQAKAHLEKKARKKLKK